MRSDRRLPLLLAAVLAAAVLGVYGQVATHAFIEYDDPGYVSENPFVRRGLAGDGLRWALTTGHMGNWNPLTWLSHMLDVSLFGLVPGAHHLVSVALHLANTLLVFALLHGATRALWCSAVVAALFGLHPLHVESVAWISERKDVLSTLCWLLALWAYGRWAATRARRWYAVTAAWFALGLMAKPMLVTLPFTLMLLDIWPLRRLTRSGGLAVRGAAARPCTGTARPVPLPALLLEKVPFLALTIVFSILAYRMQAQTGAVAAVGALPVGSRVANALVAWVRYLVMAVWPADLAVLYPHPVVFPLWQPVGAALLLALASALAVLAARRRPWGLVGWLWYLGTLVPVIGLVQIGDQALADRYTYVPLLGVFVIVAWGGREVFARLALPAPAVAAGVCIALAAYAAVAWRQVGLWRDGATLLEHTVRVTRNNYVARNNLGVALAKEGRADEAAEQYREALRLKPDYAQPLHNLGLLSAQQGRREEAVAHYRAALAINPNAPESHNNLGLVLFELGRNEEALAELNEAVRLDPTFASAHNNLANALRVAGRTEEALAHYRRALEIRPDYDDPYSNIGIILAADGRQEDAIANFRTALELDPDSREARYNLAVALTEVGRAEEALPLFQALLARDPEDAQAQNDFGVALFSLGRQAEAVDHFESALALEPDLADARTNLDLVRTMHPPTPAAETVPPGPPTE